MRYVALTAATLSSAFLLSLGSPAFTSSQKVVSANNTTNITTLTKPTVQLASQAKTPKTTTANIAAVQQPESPQPFIITVASGDTLSSIAEAHGTTFKRMFDANETVQDPNTIYPGDQLRVPSADEQLADRPLPVSAPVVAPAPVAVATPAPTQTSSQSASNAPAVAGGSVWDRLAACEAGGNWSINTGNGFYGGLQFTLGSWQAVGGTGMPNQASREEQILRGQMLQARSGWGNWPACSAMLGL